MNKPPIVFFGTPRYSLIILEKLADQGYPIVGVVTKPPTPVGRKQILTPTPVFLWAKKHEVKVLTPESKSKKPWIYDDESQLTKEVLKLIPEILIVADYSQKIPFNLISQIKFGGLNVHPSLLPKYRGPAPVPWAIYQGEKETGVTIVTLAQEFDSGKTVVQEKEPILPDDTTHTLLTRLFTKGAELLIKTLPRYVKNFPNYDQSSKNFKLLSSSYTPRLTRHHGFEPWENINSSLVTGKDAGKIERKFRAFYPWPGLWTIINTPKGKKRVILHAVTIKNQLLHVLSYQLEGKKIIFINKATELLNLST